MIKPKLYDAFPHVKWRESSSVLLIHLLYKALLKLDMGSKHDSQSLMFGKHSGKLESKWMVTFYHIVLREAVY